MNKVFCKDCANVRKSFPDEPNAPTFRWKCAKAIWIDYRDGSKNLSLLSTDNKNINGECSDYEEKNNGK